MAQPKNPARGVEATPLYDDAPVREGRRGGNGGGGRGAPPPPPQDFDIDPASAMGDQFNFDQEPTATEVLFNIGFGLLFRCISIAQRAPFDRVNYLLQVRQELRRQKKIAAKDDFDGIVPCVKVCYRKQGIVGFWRSVLVRCCSIVPLTIINNLGQQVMPSFFLMAARFLPDTPSILFANAASYIFVAGLIHPIEVVQLQVACELATAEDEETIPKERRCDGFFSCLTRICRVDGPLALWRGLGTSLFTAAVGNIAFFVIAERIHAFFPRAFETPTAQGITTFIVMTGANMVIYPLDTIRRRFMMTVGAEKQYHYKSFFQLIREMKAEPEGLFRSLYAGAHFTLLRTITSFTWGFLKMKLFPANQGGME